MDCRSPGSGSAEKALREKDRNKFCGMRISNAYIHTYIYIYTCIIFNCIFTYHAYIYIYEYEYIYIYTFEGSLVVKLPTIWRDEKQSREEAERRERLEERRVEEKE